MTEPITVVSALLVDQINAATRERDAARADLAALLATEPLAPYSEYATGRPLTACVYCGVTAPRGTRPHPHDADCAWARARERWGGAG